MRTRKFELGLLLTACFVAGCESSGGTGGLLDLGQSGAEKWTIWCQRTEGVDHRVRANLLADQLRQMPGLKPDKVRVVEGADGTTIYYGQYVKVQSPETGRLVFPREYLEDLAMIQRTTYRGTPIFRFAKPELMEAGPSAEVAQWDLNHCKAKYTLQVGIFYNTPTFQSRKQAAEEYVKQLRQDGFAAYFRHEEARSFVFVGEFDDSDVVQTADGSFKSGPRVERLIRQREEEFRYLLENGYRIRRKMPDGQMMVAPSMLVPVRHEAANR